MYISMRTPQGTDRPCWIHGRKVEFVEARVLSQRVPDDWATVVAIVQGVDSDQEELVTVVKTVCCPSATRCHSLNSICCHLGLAFPSFSVVWR